MEANRVVEETGLSTSAPLNQHLTYGIHGIISPATNLLDQQGSAYDFGELEDVLMPKFMQGVEIRNEVEKKGLYTIRPPTLEIFPSWPMRFQQTPRGNSQSTDSTTDSGSAQNTVSCKADGLLESESVSKRAIDRSLYQNQQMASDTSGIEIPNHQSKTLEKRREAGSTSEKEGSKILDAKTMRRLAQNREAARKSRLRKKAYVQQLESSRIKLTQLEQDLQRASSQGMLLAGGGAGGNISSGGATFEMEYGRWLEENERHMWELRRGLGGHLLEGELRVMVEGCLAHYDEVFRLKGVAAKSDVFHLITGLWTTPSERCFLWLGGFRPSELIKILVPQLDLTEQQFMGICSLQQSSQQAEEALSQGLQQLYHSLAETIASGSNLFQGANVAEYMGHMSLALGKLSNLQGFVCQGDNLRQQTLHQMHRILTVRQAARCFLSIGEYYNRLRALSTLWASRPRENLITDENGCQMTADLEMVQTPHNHFSTF